jgi:hypothetical protein
MGSQCRNIKSGIIFSVLISFYFPLRLAAEIKTWTGYGGDTNWLNPLNWSGAGLPQAADDVVLDNRDMPVSYKVILPVTAVILKTIRIQPSPGRNIELILPDSNKVTNAFTLTGPGYGVELDAGAIFRNASGLSSGESLVISDSIIIHDGARYIHQTRAAHANSILRLLSIAPGTEQGIFDFDVPRASYTISVSNRTYGSLELHSTAFGSAVNYTCTGANPLVIRGNLRIGAGVNMTTDLTGLNGRIQLDGDFIQEGGQLNLASGSGDNTVLRIKGDLYQYPDAVITETNNGHPFVELNGGRIQEIAMAGSILNQVGFRINNMNGSVLRLPLTLPWMLDMQSGVILSSAQSLLTLDTGCSIMIDSARQSGTWIDGPVKKMGVRATDRFLFPVGKNGFLRWLELKETSGNFSVEYFQSDPATIGAVVGSGLDHISKLEFWSIIADNPAPVPAKIELSFASSQSGGVTDPAFLNVAKFESTQWENAGHTGTTGDYIQGSVLSGTTDLQSAYFTLASTLNLENPLPLTTIDLHVNEVSDRSVFQWTIESSEVPDHFNIYQENDGIDSILCSVKAAPRQSWYEWTNMTHLSAGEHYFRVSMVDIHGMEYFGETVLLKKKNENTKIYWTSVRSDGRESEIVVQSEIQDYWQYEILAIDGRCMKKGILKLEKGTTHMPLGVFNAEALGLFIFHAIDSHGDQHQLMFKMN